MYLKKNLIIIIIFKITFFFPLNWSQLSAADFTQEPARRAQSVKTAVVWLNWKLAVGFKRRHERERGRTILEKVFTRHMHSHTLMAQTECVSEKKWGGKGGVGVRVRTAEVSKCVCERERVSQRWLPLHPHPSVSKVRGRWSSYCAINWHHLVQFSVEERLVKTTPDQVWLSACMTLLLIFICFPFSPNQHW